MVKSVVWQFHWTPDYVYERFYLDDEDSRGLKYWYDKIVEQEREIKNKTKK